MNNTNLSEAVGVAQSTFTLDNCVSNIAAACQLNLSEVQRRDMREVIRVYRTEWQNPSPVATPVGSGEQACPDCGGEGRIDLLLGARDTGAKGPPHAECDACKGTGKIMSSTNRHKPIADWWPTNKPFPAIPIGIGEQAKTALKRLFEPNEVYRVSDAAYRADFKNIGLNDKNYDKHLGEIPVGPRRAAIIAVAEYVQKKMQSHPLAAEAGELERGKALLERAYRAMRKYEMDVDEEPPYLHMQLMREIDAYLQATNQKSDEDK